MGFIESPIFWVILASLSEILSLIPSEKVQSNGIFQLIISALNTVLKNRWHGVRPTGSSGAELRLDKRTILSWAV